MRGRYHPRAANRGRETPIVTARVGYPLDLEIHGNSEATTGRLSTPESRPA